MILTRLGAAARTAIIVGVAALALAACSSHDDAAAKKAADELPDLTTLGLVEFPCGEGDAIGASFQQPVDPYVAQCWKGSPAGKTFLDVANSTQDAVIQATDGVNITDDVCPADALSAGGGIACRAALVTEGKSTVVVRSVVVLADPDTVLKDLPDKPTQDQINAVLEGAAVEVLVGTQATTDGTTPSPSASS